MTPGIEQFSPPGSHATPTYHNLQWSGRAERHVIRLAPTERGGGHVMPGTPRGDVGGAVQGVRPPVYMNCPGGSGGCGAGRVYGGARGGRGVHGGVLGHAGELCGTERGWRWVGGCGSGEVFPFSRDSISPLLPRQLLIDDGNARIWLAKEIFRCQE